MKILLISLGMIIVVTVIAFNRHNKIGELRGTISRLESQTENSSELESEIARLQSIRVDTNELDKLRGETVELMRLRAEAARLRPLAEKPKPELEEELERKESAFNRAQAAHDYEMNLLINSSNSGVMSIASSDLSTKISAYIGENERFPVSIATFSRDFSEINAVIERTEMAGADYQYASIGRVTPQDFELIPPPAGVEDWSGKAIVLREKNPRELLNGGWERNYGILGVNHLINSLRPYPLIVYETTVELQDGDFEKWEREFAEQNSGN